MLHSRKNRDFNPRFFSFIIETKSASYNLLVLYALVRLELVTPAEIRKFCARFVHGNFPGTAISMLFALKS